MNIEPLDLIKEDCKGRVFRSTGFEIVYRNKGSTSGDNSDNVEEVIYLVSGDAKLTVDSQTVDIRAPEKFSIPANTYHKIVATTDIIFLLFKINNTRQL